MPAKMFAIRESRFAAFAKAMDKLVRKASKLDSGHISWTKTGEHMSGRNDQPVTDEDQPRFKYIDIMLQGDAPKLNGWCFVAKLEHLIEVPEGQPNIIIHNPTGEDLPERFRSASNTNCDQCHRAVQRHDTFILRQSEECWVGGIALYKQVGRNCLRDFLGHHSPEQVAMYFQIYSAFFNAPDEWSNEDMDDVERGYGLRTQHYWDLEYTLAVANAMIRKYGWCSKRMSRDNPTLVATSEHVSAFVADVRMHSSANRDALEITDADHERATEIIEWLSAYPLRLASSSDYVFNLKTLAQVSSIRLGHFGLAVSMIPFWERETGHVQSWRARSQYIGTVGERLNLDNVEIYSIKQIESQWGLARYIHMRHGDNDIFWRTGVGSDFKEGLIVSIRATIKAHNEYRGCKETVLTRCKLIPIEEEVNA
jgi:hypothetical protein